ncbi:MAG: hypothetical protein JWN63_387 [Candidatus Acidoferrum typicum]|nr:hypothetical protein [Candidatus Acidoferrum typicum]
MIASQASSVPRSLLGNFTHINYTTPSSAQSSQNWDSYWRNYGQSQSSESTPGLCAYAQEALKSPAACLKDRSLSRTCVDPRDECHPAAQRVLQASLPGGAHARAFAEIWGVSVAELHARIPSLEHLRVLAGSDELFESTVSVPLSDQSSSCSCTPLIS